MPNTVLINSSLCFIIGTISGLVVARLYASNKLKKFMVKYFHKTPNDDIWRDVLDFEKGSNLKIYVKDADYYVIGHHKNHEEKGNESWLALSAFGKYKKVDNQCIINYHDSPSTLFTIRFNDIEHIEIF